jgi:hypothetical protein
MNPSGIGYPRFWRLQTQHRPQTPLDEASRRKLEQVCTDSLDHIRVKDPTKIPEFWEDHALPPGKAMLLE